jgi:hypothetical protein
MAIVFGGNVEDKDLVRWVTVFKEEFDDVEAEKAAAAGDKHWSEAHVRYVSKCHCR